MCVVLKKDVPVQTMILSVARDLKSDKKQIVNNLVNILK